MVFRWRILLQSLAVLRNVEAFQFMFAGDPQRHDTEVPPWYSPNLSWSIDRTPSVVAGCG
jgi:hypothetical protein